MAVLRSCLYAVQKAIHAKLKEDITVCEPLGKGVGIYGFASANTRPPYIKLGEFVEQEFATKLRSGSMVTATIHLYSDFEGMDELHDLSNQVLEALIDPFDKTRSPLVLDDDFAIVQGQMRLNQTVEDTDGREVHGVILLEFLVEDATEA